MERQDYQGQVDYQVEVGYRVYQEQVRQVSVVLPEQMVLPE